MHLYIQYVLETEFLYNARHSDLKLLIQSAICSETVPCLFGLVPTYSQYEALLSGTSSRNSGSLSLKGSPEPAVATSKALISVQFYKNRVAYGSDESGSGSSERVSLWFVIISGEVSPLFSLFMHSFIFFTFQKFYLLHQQSIKESSTQIAKIK